MVIIIMIIILFSKILIFNETLVLVIIATSYLSLHRCCCASERTTFIPQKIIIHGVAIASEQLRNENEVVNEKVTLGFDIHSAINEYKV